MIKLVNSEMHPDDFQKVSGVVRREYANKVDYIVYVYDKSGVCRDGCISKQRSVVESYRKGIIEKYVTEPHPTPRPQNWAGAAWRKATVKRLMSNGIYSVDKLAEVAGISRTDASVAKSEVLLDEQRDRFD